MWHQFREQILGLPFTLVTLLKGKPQEEEEEHKKVVLFCVMNSSLQQKKCPPLPLYSTIVFLQFLKVFSLWKAKGFYQLLIRDT